MADPLSDPHLDMAAVNSAAESMYRSSLQGYNTAPNPQLATEAITTQSHADVAQLLAAGDPVYGSNATATVGGTATVKYGDYQIASPTTDQFDYGAYSKAMDDLKKSPFADQIPSVKALGEIPQFNVGYMESTIQHASQDKDFARSWQQHLRDGGFIASDHPVDGTWDGASSEAVTSYLMQLALPEAMNGQNAQKRDNARAFYMRASAMVSKDGMPIDPNDLAKNFSKGDAASEEFKNTVFQQWFQSRALGSGNKIDQSALVSEFIDQYGKDAVPQKWQDLASGGWIHGLMNDVSGLVNMTTDLAKSALDHIPVVRDHPDVNAWISKLANPMYDIVAPGNYGLNVLMGNGLGPDSFMNTKDATKSRLEKELDINKMSKQDQAFLKPMIQSAASHQGFMGAASDWWGQRITQAQLLVGYTVLDMMTGKDFTRSPLDSLSSPFIGATVHDDNLTAAILGDQWSKDHESSAQILNMAGNLLDPTLPISWELKSFQVARAVETSAQMLKGVEEINLARGGKTIAEVFPTVENALNVRKNPAAFITRVVKPRAQLAQATEHAIVGAWLKPGTKPKDMMGIMHLTSEEDHALLRKHMVTDPQTGEVTLKPLTAEEIKSTFANEIKYASSLAGWGTQYNLTAHLKVISPENFRKLMPDQIRRLITLGGVVNNSIASGEHAHGVKQVMDDMEHMGNTVHMDPQVLHKYINEYFMEASGERRNAILGRFHVEQKKAVREWHESRDPVAIRAKKAEEAVVEAKKAKAPPEQIAQLEREAKDLRSQVTDHARETDMLIERRSQSMTYNKVKGTALDLFQNIHEAFQKPEEKPTTEGLPEPTTVPSAESEAQAAEVLHKPEPVISGSDRKQQLFATGKDLGEMSTVPLKPKVVDDPELKALLAEHKILEQPEAWKQAVTKAREGEANKFYETVQLQYEHTHGMKAGTMPDHLLATAIEEFKAHPGGAEALATMQKDIARLDQWYAKMFPVGSEVQRPLYAPQLSNHFVHPYTNFDYLLMMHPNLRKWEFLQDVIHADKWASLWKLMAITRPSTVLRAAVGDDIMRSSIELAFMGAPRAAIMNLVKSLARGAKMPFSEGARARVWENIGHDLTGVHMQDWHSGLSNMAYEGTMPGEYGHREGITWFLSDTTNSPHITKAAANLRTMGREQAEAQLYRDILDPKDLDAAAIQHSRGLSDFILNQQRDAATKASEAKAQLEEATARSANKGDFQAIYRPLPKRIVPGQKAPKTKQEYIDRIQAYIDDQQADTTPSEGIKRWVTQVMDHLDYIATPHPEIRDHMLSMLENHDPHSAANKKWLDHVYANKNLMNKLPNIVLRRKTIEGQRTALRLLHGMADGFMERVFGPVIAASRATGAEYIKQQHLDHLSAMLERGEISPKGDPQKWIESKANASAMSWIQQNTYMATRTVGDLVVRNVFPFVGATTSMDRFFLRQFAAHPWTIDYAVRAGLKAGQMAEDKSGRTTGGPLGGWLGAAMFGGGDVFSGNPLNFSFVSGDGIASAVPGLGPMGIILAGTIGNDTLVKPMIDALWGSHAAAAPQLAPGAAGTLLQQASAMSTLAGGPALELPKFLGGTSGLFARAVDIKTRQLTAQTGQVPDEGTVRKLVSEEQMTTGLLNYLLPAQVQIGDERAQRMAQARNEIAQGADKASILSKYSDVAPALEYTDPTTPSARQQQILDSNPWVEAYATSMYSNPTGERASTLADFDAKVAKGDINLMGYDAYSKNLDSHYKVAQGYSDYRTKIAPIIQRWLNDNPNETPSGAAYKAFHQAVVNPAIMDLERTNAPFRDAFERTVPRDPKGLAYNSQPISSLTGWSFLPDNIGNNSEINVAMRQVVTVRDQIANEIWGLRQAGGTQAQMNEQKAIFEQSLIDIANGLPEPARSEFHNRMDVYHYGRIQDFLALRVGDLQAQSILGQQ